MTVNSYFLSRIQSLLHFHFHLLLPLPQLNPRFDFKVYSDVHLGLKLHLLIRLRSHFQHLIHLPHHIHPNLKDVEDF
jgi:hypothetical protein